MSAERLLERLHGVRRTGRGRWLARCPAHEDRSPSLSIREASDGRILIYDFAGCGAIEVLDAVGLDWADLFPPKSAWTPPTATSPTQTNGRAPRIPASDALLMLDNEALVVEIIAIELAKGEPVEQHRPDLELAAHRIAAVRSAWRTST